jgi:hypothetical protein
MLNDSRINIYIPNQYNIEVNKINTQTVLFSRTFRVKMFLRALHILLRVHIIGILATESFDLRTLHAFQRI